MVHEVQLANIKGVQGSLQQKVLPGPPEQKPPHPNTVLERKLMLGSCQHRLEANQVCLSPESGVLSLAWHSFSHRSGLRSSPAQARGMALCIQDASEARPEVHICGQSPTSGTAASRHSATEFSQVKHPSSCTTQLRLP